MYDYTAKRETLLRCTYDQREFGFILGYKSAVKTIDWNFEGESGDPRSFPVAFERSNFWHSYIPFAIVHVKRREKESRRSIDIDRRWAYSIARSRHPIVNPRPSPLQIHIPTVGILCSRVRFTRFSISLPYVPYTDRLSCSLFLLILHRIVHLATCSTTCSSVDARGWQLCGWKRHIHIYTHKRVSI